MFIQLKYSSAMVSILGIPINFLDKIDRKYILVNLTYLKQDLNLLFFNRFIPDDY
jgi:hypothetical protein